MVAVAGAVTVCDSAPPSDHEVKAYCVLPEVCGEVVAIVCEVPTVQVSDCELV